MLKKFIITVFGLGAIGLYIYFLVLPTPPCSKPVTYGIGTVDTRFGITKDAFSSAAREAVGQWEQAAGKHLFTEALVGDVMVSAVYDKRQEVRDRLDKMGVQIAGDKESFTALQKKHDALAAAYDTAIRTYETVYARYTAEDALYKEGVARLHSGSATRDDSRLLETKRLAINAMVDELAIRKAALKEQLLSVNALAEALNQSVQQHNTAVDDFNTVSGTLPKEYEGGLYKSAADGNNTVAIFTFTSHAELVGLLAHEFGHALGLGHVEDPHAIMYRLNLSNTGRINETDVQALKLLCVLK
ncbi:MAG: hypothetical protein JWM56_1164 [Candidatus Peribacteria bacterium]|nr:hypothetical protein [Candidatus Peribacteria bacterium]